MQPCTRALLLALLCLAACEGRKTCYAEGGDCVCGDSSPNPPVPSCDDSHGDAICCNDGTTCTCYGYACTAHVDNACTCTIGYVFSSPGFGLLTCEAQNGSCCIGAGGCSCTDGMAGCAQGQTPVPTCDAADLIASSTTHALICSPGSPTDVCY